MEADNNHLTKTRLAYAFSQKAHLESDCISRSSPDSFIIVHAQVSHAELTNLGNVPTISL